MITLIGTFGFSVPDVPPSVNKTRGEHWAKTSKRKRVWQESLELTLLAQRLPRPLERVHATAEITMPVQRRRDEGNYRALLEKALGDALVNGGWLKDDTPQFFTFGAVTFDPNPGKRRTTLYLEVVQ